MKHLKPSLVIVALLSTGCAQQPLLAPVKSTSIPETPAAIQNYAPNKPIDYSLKAKDLRSKEQDWSVRLLDWSARVKSHLESTPR